MKIVLADQRLGDEAVRRLSILGYRVIGLPPLDTLPSAIASHPDTLVFRHGGRLITTADYCDAAAFVFSDLRESVADISVDFISDSHGAKYPGDCLLNAAVVGDKIFCRKDSVAAAITEYANKVGLTVVDTRQGYAACATLVLDEGHVITADAGLAKIYRECGIDVLKIDCGGISLPPYEYGFIGGCAGVDGGTVFFIGDIATHPSCAAIIEYIESLGMRAVSLEGGNLTDLGGLYFFR